MINPICTYKVENREDRKDRVDPDCVFQSRRLHTHDELPVIVHFVRLTLSLLDLLVTFTFTAKERHLINMTNCSRSIKVVADATE